MKKLKLSIIGIIFLFLSVFWMDLYALDNVFDNYNIGNEIYSNDFSVGFDTLQTTSANFSLNNEKGLFTYGSASEGILVGSDQYNELTNYSVSANFILTEGKTTNNTTAAILFRYVDNNNYYMYRYRYINDVLAVQLYKKENGTFSSLKEYTTTISKQLDVEYSLRIDVVNNHVIGYFDQNQVLAYDFSLDNYVKKGNFGIRTYQGNFLFDDLVVKQIETDEVNEDIEKPDVDQNINGTIVNDNYKIEYFSDYSFKITNLIDNSVGLFYPKFVVISGTTTGSKGSEQTTVANDNYFKFISWNKDISVYNINANYDYLLPTSQKVENNKISSSVTFYNFGHAGQNQVDNIVSSFH